MNIDTLKKIANDPYALAVIGGVFVLAGTLLNERSKALQPGEELEALEAQLQATLEKHENLKEENFNMAMRILEREGGLKI